MSPERSLERAGRRPAARPSRRAALLVALAAFGSPGCGFIITNGPPADHATMPYFSCTESKAGPILDVVWAGLNLAGTAVVAANPGDYRDETLTIAGGIGWGVLSTASAVTGFKKVSRCREAKLEWALRRGDSVPPAAEPPSLRLGIPPFR